MKKLKILNFVIFKNNEFIENNKKIKIRGEVRKKN